MTNERKVEMFDKLSSAMVFYDNVSRAARDNPEGMMLRKAAQDLDDVVQDIYQIVTGQKQDGEKE